MPQPLSLTTALSPQPKEAPSLKPIDPKAGEKLAARRKASAPAPEPGFEGLQEVKVEEPGFEGLEQVSEGEVEAGFEGLQEADAVDLKSAQELVDDDTFHPVQYFAEHPDLNQDATKFQKVLDAYRARRERGLEAGRVAKEAVKAAPGILAKTAKGAVNLVERAIDIGVQPTVNLVSSFLLGDSPEMRKAVMDETGKQQLKAASEVTAGTEAAVTGLAQLGQQGVRKLFGKSVKDQTDFELEDALRTDAEFHKLTSRIAEGQGDASKLLGIDAETLKKNGVELDAEAIQNLSLVDPVTLVATAGVFKVVGVGGKILATAATRAGGEAVLNGLKRVATTAAANTVRVAGKGAELAGKGVQKLPVRTPSLVATGGQLAAGDLGGAILAAAAPTAIKAGGKVLEKTGRTVAELGEQMVPGFTGPQTAGMARLSQLAAGPVGQIAKGATKGAVAGTVVAAPLAAAADESETAGALLGGGFALGAVAGGAIAGKNAVASAVAKRYLDPHSIPFQPVDSPGYGIDGPLDRAHEAAISALPESERNAINNFREALREQGGEIYVLDPESYGQKIRESMETQNGGKPLTPEQETALKAYADTHATFDSYITDANGTQRRVVFLNQTAKGLPHDAGHLFQSLLNPERQAALRQAVFDAYSGEQLAEFAKAYQERLGDPTYFEKLGPEAGRNKVADEIIAENFSQIFGNAQLADLKAPAKFLESLGRVAAEAGEALGIDLTSGRTTPDLNVAPSYRLQNILRNASRQVLNLPKADAKAPFLKQGELELAPAPKVEKSVVPADITPVKPPAQPTLTPGPAKAKAPKVDETAKRSQETGAEVARSLTKDNPEAAQAVEKILQSMEAGNPVLKIEHRGIVSEKGVPREPGRTQRRGEQETGYAELEALQIENRKDAPADIVDIHEKTFVPVRWVEQGGKATLVAMSMDKILANIRKAVADASAKGAGDLIPYEQDNGKLTPAGWEQALQDVRAYAENQSHGYRGDGQKLVRPDEGLGASIPAEDPNYTPKVLDEAKANFANLVQGLVPPKTARSTKGVPGNVKGQVIAEINKRTPQTPAGIKPSDIQKQTFKKPFENRTVKETNPLRNQLAERGVDIRNLTEVTERFAAEDIASVEPSTGPQMKAPVTDTIRGGFLPAGEPVSSTVDRVFKATPEEWRQFFPGSNLTKTAYELGLGLKNAVDLNTLKVAQEAAQARAAETMTQVKAGNFDLLDQAAAEATKVQFFREAIEAATDSGSAAGSSGWRRFIPEGKPPFAKEKSIAGKGRGDLDRLFLPAEDANQSLDPVKMAAIRTKGGNIITGAWHGEAYMNLADAVAKGEIQEKLPPGVTSLTEFLDSLIEVGGPSGFVEDGFVTESGKFLNRAEAFEHAEKIKQLKPSARADKFSPRGSGVLESAEFARDRSFLPPEGSKEIRDLAEGYAKSAGIDYAPTHEYAEIKPELMKKLADYYESAKSAPNDKGVQASYDALTRETLAQYRAMTDAGYVIEPWDGKGEPYKSSADAVADIRDNKHLYFLKTENAFGSGREAKANPMLADSGIEINGQKLLVNDIFRAVHDFFGHGKEGYQFGPRGEFNAWRAHSEMFSPEAQGALAAETLAQNSWVNFGKHLRNAEGGIPGKGEKGFVSPAERPFAEQKNIVIPTELIEEARGAASGERSFAPGKRRDEQGRPLTKDGLVDYERLYRELAAKRKAEEAQRDATDLSKYNVEPSQRPSGDKQTGWLTPKGEFVGLDEAYHQDWLAKNHEALNEEFGTNLKPEANIEDRLTALNSGFVRFRDVNGNLVIELNSKAWKGGNKKAIVDRVLDRADTTNKLQISLLDNDGNVVDSASVFLFDADSPREVAQQALDKLNPLIQSAKGKGPTAIQRARAMGESSAFLPKEGTPEFDAYASTRERESRQFPEALPLEFRKDEGGHYKAGFNGEPLPVAKTYDLLSTPLAKKSKGKTIAETEEKLTDALAEGLQKGYRDAKKNPDIEAGETWYSICREKLQTLLGDDTKLFAELLGATSAQTNVDANFGFALEAYNLFKRGEYDLMLAKYREGKKAFANDELDQFTAETGKKGAKATYDAFMNWWIDKHGLIPVQSNGKRFGMNSKAVLRVLDGSWMQQVKGPKTPNFTGNLTGTTFEATIDVWAARLLHRLGNEGNKGRWRIQPANETGVTDQDFFLGQKAFRKAAKALGIQPDALQAILWFAEKHYWEDRGWTKSVGAKKSDYNSLLQKTEKTPEGQLKRVTDQMELKLEKKREPEEPKPEDIIPRRKKAA